MARFDVDLDNGLAPRVQELVVLERRVGRAKLGPYGQDQVGFRDDRVRRLQAERPEDTQRERVGLGEDALARRGRHDRRAKLLGEGLKLGAGTGDADAVAGHDQWPRRPLEQAHGTLDLGLRAAARASSWLVARYGAVA